MHLFRFVIKFLALSVFLTGCSFNKTNPCIKDDSQNFSLFNTYTVVCFDTIDSYDLNYDDGKKLKIYAKLFLPPYKKSKYNAVVLSHGSGGIRKYHNRYIEFLTKAGYVVFQIDHYLARGIRYDKTFSKVSGITFMNDAYKALDILKTYNNIDKISYIGWSQGGVGPILSHFNEIADRASKYKFDAAIALYPYCGFTFNKNMDTGTPLLIIAGQDDDLTPEKPCIDLHKKFKKDDRVFDFISLENARHGFDNPFLFFGFEFSNLPSLNNHSNECTLTINENGNIKTVAGEIIFGPNESADIINKCSSRGVIVQYNDRATNQAEYHVLNFLSKIMNNM